MKFSFLHFVSFFYMRETHILKEVIDHPLFTHPLPARPLPAHPFTLLSARTPTPGQKHGARDTNYNLIFLFIKLLPETLN